MSTDAENCPACKAGKLCLAHGSGVYLNGPDGLRKATPEDVERAAIESGMSPPETGPLDPDQVKCPRCYAEPGKPCRTPSGARAQKLHEARKRAARPDGPQTPSPHGKGFTSEQASEAAKKAAQSRRRRKSELEAEAEDRRVQLEREKLEAEADRLARDASRYADQRAKLKARVLDVAVAAFDATHEALTHQRRIMTDEEGRILTVPVEVEVPDPNDEGGTITKTIEMPDERGYATAKDAASLMAAAAAALDKVRLEEDKPTGIHRNESRDPLAGELVEKLGTEGVEKLIETARMLDGMTPPTEGNTP